MLFVPGLHQGRLWLGWAYGSRSRQSPSQPSSEQACVHPVSWSINKKKPNNWELGKVSVLGKEKNNTLLEMLADGEEGSFWISCLQARKAILNQSLGMFELIPGES